MSKEKYLDQKIDKLKQQLEEKDEQINYLEQICQICNKELNWYSTWHEIFQKQIEDLTTELEIYKPTKLHGNGQCECYKCNTTNWTDWCSRYKGHTYCDDCLKEVLKEDQTPQIQLTIQELEKVKTLIQNAINFEKPNFVEVYDAINNQINDLRGKKDVKD